MGIVFLVAVLMSKRRKKPYRPRPVRVPAIVGNHNIFAAPLRLLQDIRHSYVLEMQGDVILTSMDESEIYGAAGTLKLFAYVLKEYGIKDTSPLVRLANRLESDMPIDDAALTPVEEIFKQGQRLANTFTPEQSLAILREYDEVRAI